MAIKLDLTKFEGVGNIKHNQQDITESDLYNNIKGYAQMATQGASFGQAPHLAGVTNELANLKNKVYGAKTINDLIKLYKDTGKDYVKGREEAKQQMKEFEQENPYSSLGAELAGGLLTGGLASKGLQALANSNRILKASKLLNNPIGRASAEGALYGTLYGASNTKDKAFDPLGSAIGATSGAVGGAALGTLGKLAKNLFLSKNKGKIGELLTPPGIHEDTINNIVTDAKVAEAVAGGDIGKKVGTYSSDVQKSLTNLKDTVNSLKKQAYDGIEGKTPIDLNKTQSVDSIEKAIKEVEKNIGSDTQSRKILNGAKSVLKDIKETQKQSPTRTQVKGGILRDYETVTEDILRNPDRQIEIVKIPRQEITKENYNEEIEKAFTLFDEASNGRKLITNSTDNIIVDVPTGAKGEIMKDLIQIKNPDLQNAAIHQIRNMQDLFYQAHKISEHPEVVHGKPNVDTVSRYATPFELVNKEGKPDLYRAKFTVYKYKDGRNVVAPEILELNKGTDYGLYALKTYGGNKKSPQGLGANRIDGTNPPKYGDTISIGDLADYVNTFDNKVSLDKLKNLKDRIYRLKNSAYKTEPTGDKKRLVSQDTIDMLDNIYSSLVNAEKEHSPQLKFANEFYSDMKNVGKELADLKLYDEDTIAKSATKYGRDIAGNVFKLAEDRVKSILDKYENTKGLSNDLFTNMKKLQVAKNIKPDANYGVIKTPIQFFKNIVTGGNREQKMQSLAQAVKDGKITKEMLDKEIQKGNIAVAPFINYYLALSKVPQANMASNAISKILPKNTKSYLEKYVLPRVTIKQIVQKYYDKEKQ